MFSRIVVKVVFDEFIFPFFFGFSSFIYFYHIYFFEFGSLGSQTHKSQTRWPTSTLACITPCLFIVKGCCADFFLLILSSHFSRSSRPDVFCEQGKACNFIKKETLAQVLSREFCEIFENTFFLQNTSGGRFCFFLMGKCCEKNNGSLKVVSILRISSYVDNFSGPMVDVLLISLKTKLFWF